MSLSILYISYDGMTDPLGQSQVLPYLAGLVRRGYHITLLSCEKAGRFEQHRPLIGSLCREAGINWQPIPYRSSPPVISTIRDVRTLKEYAESLYKNHQFDIVHCRSYISALIGLWMKKKYGTRFVFDMRGFWADERVDGGLWKRSNPLYNTIYKWFKRKERQFLEQADAVVSLTHAAKEEIQQWPLSVHKPVTVIPCCVDTHLFTPANSGRAEQAALRQELEIPESSPVLGYVGSLGTWYLLPEMLAFFKTWLRGQPGSILLFVTMEPKEIIFAEAARQQVDEARIRVVSAARDQMPAYISLMDYGLFFLKQAFSKKASSPVKQGELMAMGIPVICNAGVGDSDRIIREYHAGVLVEEYSEAGYLKAIETLFATNFDPVAIRAGCLDYFDLEQGVSAYEGVYNYLQ